jgi:hypothetical protein
VSTTEELLGRKSSDNSRETEICQKKISSDDPVSVPIILIAIIIITITVQHYRFPHFFILINYNDKYCKNTHTYTHTHTQQMIQYKTKIQQTSFSYLFPFLLSFLFLPIPLPFLLIKFEKLSCKDRWGRTCGYRCLKGYHHLQKYKSSTHINTCGALRVSTRVNITRNCSLRFRAPSQLNVYFVVLKLKKLEPLIADSLQNVHYLAYNAEMGYWESILKNNIENNG